MAHRFQRGDRVRLSDAARLECTDEWRENVGVVRGTARYTSYGRRMTWVFVRWMKQVNKRMRPEVLEIAETVAQRRQRLEIQHERRLKLAREVLRKAETPPKSPATKETSFTIEAVLSGTPEELEACYRACKLTRLRHPKR